MDDQEPIEPRSSRTYGTVEPLPSGRYRARITLADGRRVSVGVYDTEGAAETALAAAEEEVAGCGQALQRQLTLYAFGLQYLKGNVRKRSIKTDRDRWDDYLLHDVIGELPLKGLAPRHVLRFLERLEQRTCTRGKRKGLPLSRGTIRLVYALLREVCGRAVMEELLLTNPCRDVKLGKLGADTGDISVRLTPEEQIALFTCRAIPELDRCILLIEAQGGYRPGELESLLLTNVHLDDREPFVLVATGTTPKVTKRPPLSAREMRRRKYVAYRLRHDLAVGMGVGNNHPSRRSAVEVSMPVPRRLAPTKGTAGPTKSGKERRIPIFSFGVAAWRRYLELLPTYCPHNPRGLAFPGPLGGFRTSGHFFGDDKKGSRWVQFLKLAGITRDVRFYDLRHTCGTSLVSGWYGRPWSLEETKPLLGHGSIRMTEHYSRMEVSSLFKAASETSKHLGVDFGFASTPNDHTFGGARDLVEILQESVVGRPGLEPGTYGLKVRSSTD
jgi:integrase